MTTLLPQAYSKYRVLILRVLLVATGCSLIWRFYSKILVSQIVDNQLRKVGSNLTYHLFELIGFHSLFSNYKVAIAFDILLFLSLILLIIKPLNKPLAILFLFLFNIMNVYVNISITHSVHFLAQLVILLLILIPKKDVVFDTLWEGLRFFICGTYFVAFLLKILNGAVGKFDNGILILKSNMAAYMYLHPDSIHTHIYEFMIRNPFYVNIGSYFMYLLEGLFVIGFFTKRYDRWLAITLILLHTILYYFVNTLFIESFISIIVFVPLTFWMKMNNNYPIFNK